MDWPSKPVGRKSRERDGEGRASAQARVLWSRQARKAGGELQDVRTVNRHRWVRRVASGERVKRGQGTRHNDPVTSEEGMPESGEGLRAEAGVGRSESAQATV